jgi:hypothetical protein
MGLDVDEDMIHYIPQNVHDLRIHVETFQELLTI